MVPKNERGRRIATHSVVSSRTCDLTGLVKVVLKELRIAGPIFGRLKLATYSLESVRSV